MIAEMFLDPKRRAEIADGGRRCIAEAHANGVSAIYRHPDTGLPIEEMPDGTIRPVRIAAQPESFPDSVVERIQEIADAHPEAEVTLVGGLAWDMQRDPGETDEEFAARRALFRKG